MNAKDLLETLAAIEHERWADWQKYLHGKCTANAYPSGSLTIPGGYVASLERQMFASYPDLTEAEKQSDREQVARYWPLIVEFVAEWIESKSGDDLYSGCHFRIRDMAAHWREDMKLD